MATTSPSRDVVTRAKTRWDEAISGWDDNFRLFREDIRFLDGDHWDALDVAARATPPGRPCLTFNREPTYVDQVVGDARQQRPQIKVAAVHPQAGRGRTMDEKPKDVDLAEVMNGLVRHIQRASFAHIAYDTAVEHAAGHGLGWLRVVKAYSEADPFVHELKIARIRDWSHVIFDPASTEATGEDARYCFVWDYMPKDEYEDAYGSKAQADWASLDSGWYDGVQGVRVAEYFERTRIKRLAVKLSDGRVVYDDDLDKVLDELAEQYGVEVVDSKKVDCWKVTWWKLSGLDVLEGPTEIECPWIPVVPVYGKELVREGKITYRGVTRHMHDASKAYNYARTTSIERVANTPKPATLLTSAMIRGHESVWNDPRPRNYRLINPDPQMPGWPIRQETIDTDVGALQEAERSLDDMRGTTGLHEASLGDREGQESGRAIQALQRKGDLGTFAYVDNLGRAIAQLGRCLVHWIPKVYDTQRVVSILMEDETDAYVMLRQEVQDEETGEVVVLNDLAATAYHVSVQVGPSYSTLRAEAADSMMTMAQAAPQLLQLAGDIMIRNMEWPGAQEIADRLRRTIPPAVLGEDEEPQPPTPEQELAAADLQVRQKESEAKMAKAEADMAKAEADMAEALQQIQMLPQQIASTIREILSQPVEQLMGGGNDNGL